MLQVQHTQLQNERLLQELTALRQSMIARDPTQVNQHHVDVQASLPFPSYPRNPAMWVSEFEALDLPHRLIYLKELLHVIHGSPELQHAMGNEGVLFLHVDDQNAPKRPRTDTQPGAMTLQYPLNQQAPMRLSTR